MGKKEKRQLHSEDEEESNGPSVLKKDKKSKKVKKDKKDKKDKKEKKDKKKARRESVTSEEAPVIGEKYKFKKLDNSDVEASDESLEFVAQHKNGDLKEELFGLKNRKKVEDEDSKTNFLNGKAYSAKYFSLLEQRKNLPAW